MELLVGFHYVPKRVPVKVDMEPWVCPLSWTLLGAHVAFTMSAEPDMVPALLVAKITGGIIAAAISLYATRSEK